MQTSYTQDPAIGIAGDWATSDPNRKGESCVAEGVIPVGIVVVRGTNKTRQVKQPAALAAADPDAFLATGFATAAAVVAKGSADMDGALGAAATRIWPPRNYTATLSSHADFNVGELKLVGLGPDGVTLQEETLQVPDAGNTTLAGKLHFTSPPRAAVLSTMGGTGGAITLGFGTDIGPIDGREVRGVAMRDAGKVSLTDHADKSGVTVARKGTVHVACETVATAGDPVFVRLVATGNEVLGAVRKDADGSAGAPDAVPLVGARFDKTIAAAGIVPIVLDL